MWPALGVVRREQCRRCPQREDVSELPGQVAGVPDPGAEPLPDERRGEVRGISQQEDVVAVAEAAGQGSPVGVCRDAHDLQPLEVVPAGPGTQQPTQLRRVTRAHPQLELPAVAVADHPHEGRCPRGVADLLDTAPGVERQVAAHVDDQPALGEAEVLHRDADQVPDRRAGPVAPEHRRGRERPRRAVQDRVHDRRACGPLQPYDVGAPVHHDQRVVQDPGEQKRLEIGLVEHVGEREAVVAAPGIAQTQIDRTGVSRTGIAPTGVARTGVAQTGVARTGVAGELREHPALSVEQPQAGGGTGAGQKRGADADPVQHPQHLVIEVDGPRERVRGQLPLQDRHGDPEVGHQQRCSQPNGPRPDHDDDGRCSCRRGAHVVTVLLEEPWHRPNRSVEDPAYTRSGRRQHLPGVRLAGPCSTTPSYMRSSSSRSVTSRTRMIRTLRHSDPTSCTFPRERPQRSVPTRAVLRTRHDVPLPMLDPCPPQLTCPVPAARCSQPARSSCPPPSRGDWSGTCPYTKENGGQGLDHLVHPSLAETTARVVGALSTVALAFVAVVGGRSCAVLVPAIVLGVVVAAAGRVATAGVIGVNIGGVLTVLLPRSWFCRCACGWPSGGGVSTGRDRGPSRRRADPARRGAPCRRVTRCTDVSTRWRGRVRLGSSCSLENAGTLRIDARVRASDRQG